MLNRDVQKRFFTNFKPIGHEFSICGCNYPQPPAQSSVSSRHRAKRRGSDTAEMNSSVIVTALKNSRVAISNASCTWFATYGADTVRLAESAVDFLAVTRRFQPCGKPRRGCYIDALLLLVACL